MDLQCASFKKHNWQELELYLFGMIENIFINQKSKLPISMAIKSGKPYNLDPQNPLLCGISQGTSSAKDSN
jgi:hypothetical protein